MASRKPAPSPGPTTASEAIDTALDHRAELLARWALLTRARARRDPAQAPRAAAIGRQAERARIPAVEAVEHQAVLHGRVVGPDGAGQADVEVAVVDGKRRETARGETAEVGYFQFVFPATAAGKTAKVRVEARVGKEVSRTELVEIAAGQVVYVELTAP